MPFDGHCVPENIALIWVMTELLDTNGASAPDEIHLMNRFVLTFLYAAWDGSEWNEQSLWLSKESECSWHGVECDDRGTLITSLSIKENNLKGILETRIGLLSDLKTLDLSGNQLQGSIPDEIWTLPRIGEFDTCEIFGNEIDLEFSIDLSFWSITFDA